MTTAVPPNCPSPIAPGRSMRPDVGGRPHSSSISVVLPDPLAPVTATCSPDSMVRLSGSNASWSAPGYRNRAWLRRTGSGATGSASVTASSLCTSGIPRSRSKTRDSAHQPTRDTSMIEKIELTMISTGQFRRMVPAMTRVCSADSRNIGIAEIAFNVPSMLAVIASRVSVRSRTSTVRAAMINNPLRTPATADTAMTNGVPPPRRLMMPVIPPT